MYEPRRPQTNFDDIGEFHYKFGLPSVTHERRGAEPRDVPDDLLGFRLNFLLEELTELVGAAGAHYQPEFDPIDRHSLVGMQVVIPGDGKRDHAEMFDALLDLVVVAMGTAHMFGYPWQAGWTLVQRANMSKIKAAADGSDSKRGSSYDIVKPEGWTKPDIEALLRSYGWDI